MQVGHVKDAGDRRMQGITMSYDVHWVSLMSKGIVPEDDVEVARREMIGAADELLLIDKILYEVGTWSMECPISMPAITILPNVSGSHRVLHSSTEDLG